MNSMRTGGRADRADDGAVAGRAIGDHAPSRGDDGVAAVNIAVAGGGGASAKHRYRSLIKEEGLAVAGTGYHFDPAVTVGHVRAEDGGVTDIAGRYRCGGRHVASVATDKTSGSNVAPSKIYRTDVRSRTVTVVALINVVSCQGKYCSYVDK